jgi:putative photosynthetic complex assembly protein 2
MSDYAQPALFALFLWWFSTGVILYLDRLPTHTFKWSLAGAFLILVASLWGLHHSSTDTTVAGAYIGFTCGLMIWAWQEISFYTGAVTGPRKITCEKGCSGWRHFGHAIEANLFHELSILLFAVLCVALTQYGANKTGLWTYLLLWWMHESARLNVFLGVRNLNEQFLPEHMAFLRSFLRRKPINVLFPFSVTISTLMTFWLAQQALGANSDGSAASFSFLAALLALAVLEHWFLVLPLPAEKLWSWSLPRKGTDEPQEQEHQHASGAVIVPLSRGEEPPNVKRVERRAGSARL